MSTLWGMKRLVCKIEQMGYDICGVAGSKIIWVERTRSENDKLHLLCSHLRHSIVLNYQLSCYIKCNEDIKGKWLMGLMIEQMTRGIHKKNVDVFFSSSLSFVDGSIQ